MLSPGGHRHFPVLRPGSCLFSAKRVRFPGGRHRHCPVPHPVSEPGAPFPSGYYYPALFLCPSPRALFPGEAGHSPRRAAACGAAALPAPARAPDAPGQAAPALPRPVLKNPPPAQTDRLQNPPFFRLPRRRPDQSVLLPPHRKIFFPLLLPPSGADLPAPSRRGVSLPLPSAPGTQPHPFLFPVPILSHPFFCPNHSFILPMPHLQFHLQENILRSACAASFRCISLPSVENSFSFLADASSFRCISLPSVEFFNAAVPSKL